jgi:putative transposase
MPLTAAMAGPPSSTTPDDYQAFIRLLRKACARLPMRLLGFCLLPNHFHLVLWPQGDEQFSRA